MHLTAPFPHEDYRDMLKIDPEFRSLIPPLSEDEYKGLESLILEDGCLDALKVWNRKLDEFETAKIHSGICKGNDCKYELRSVPPSEWRIGDGIWVCPCCDWGIAPWVYETIILDGHNRFEICQKHNLPFDTTEVEFDSRDDAKIWIIRFQFGRRNLEDYQRIELALLLEPLLAAKAKERQRASGGDKVSEAARAVVPMLEQPLKVDAIPPKPNRTLKTLADTAGVSTGTMAKGKVIAKHAPEETKEKLRKGEMSINAAYQSVRPSTPKEKPEPATPSETITDDAPSMERPKPARENYRINVNRVSRAASICEEIWAMVNKESFQVSVVEVRGKVKVLRDELSDLKNTLDGRN